MWSARPHSPDEEDLLLMIKLLIDIFPPTLTLIVAYQGLNIQFYREYLKFKVLQHFKPSVLFLADFVNEFIS